MRARIAERDALLARWAEEDRRGQRAPTASERGCWRAQRTTEVAEASDHSAERRANASTSSSVVDQPTDRRSERSASTPMASSTGDGSSDSDEHDAARVGGDAGLVEAEQHRLGLDAVDAEADQVGEPAASGRRRRRRPATASGGVEQPRSVRRRASRLLGGHAAAGGLGRGAEARRWPGRSRARPAGARSWSPPTSSGGRRSPRRTSRAPDAGRAAELVGAHRHQVGAELVEVDGHVPGGLGGVDVDEHAGARGTARRPRRPAGGCRPRGCPTGSAPARARAAMRGARPRRGRSDPAPSTATVTTGPARADAVPHARVLDRRAHTMAPGPARRRPTPRR